jgi:hypothetical protein
VLFVAWPPEMLYTAHAASSNVLKANGLSLRVPIPPASDDTLWGVLVCRLSKVTWLGFSSSQLKEFCEV